MSPCDGAKEILPRVGFKPTKPQQAAGILMEPPPSLACAIGTDLDATADAEPPLEPPVVLFVSYGFLVGPNSFGSVVIINPYSGAADLPQINAPLDIKRFVKTLLNFCLVFFRYLLPCIMG